MYKVFINDKVICFASPDFKPGKGTRSIPEGLSPREMVGHVNDSASTGTFVLKCKFPLREFKVFLKAFTMIRAAGGVVRKGNENGKILLIYRLGKWDLPKGKIDAGESRRKAAIREVEEECGIDRLKIIAPLADMHHLYQIKDQWVMKETYWYEMICTSTSQLRPQTEEGITEAVWMSPSAIKKILPKAYASIAALLKTVISG